MFFFFFTNSYIIITSSLKIRNLSLYDYMFCVSVVYVIFVTIYFALQSLYFLHVCIIYFLLNYCFYKALQPKWIVSQGVNFTLWHVFHVFYLEHYENNVLNVIITFQRLKIFAYLLRLMISKCYGERYMNLYNITYS